MRDIKAARQVISVFYIYIYILQLWIGHDIDSLHTNIDTLCVISKPHVTILLLKPSCYTTPPPRSHLVVNQTKQIPP